MRSTFLSLVAIANAVMVTETDYATFYVTVDGQAPVATTEAAATVPVVSIESTNTPVPTTPTTPVTATPESPNAADTTPQAVKANQEHETQWKWTTNGIIYWTSIDFGDTTPTGAPASPSAASSTSSSAPQETTSEPAATTSSTPAAPTTTSTPAQTLSTTTSSESPPSATNSFEADILNYHNRVRKEHHVGPMTWNDTLAKYAQDYLNQDNCVFKHSGGPYGENIAIGYDSTDAALDAWYNEEDNYDYEAGEFTEGTGHFTQMVWKGSHQIGCATYDCSSGTFLVCEYYYPGNYIGDFKNNVFPK